MTSPLAQQKQLLEDRICILQRLEARLQWSLDRLPDVDGGAIDNPAVSERISAIVDRFCKLQDQLAGSLRHAHSMLGEKQRSFQDVITWAVSQDILPNQAAWLELRALRNRLTHEYDLETDRLPELLTLVRQAKDILAIAITRFTHRCGELDLRD